MAGKRSIKNQDSTGLLLDTVTNAFGGIILIALLIALTASSSIDGLKREADEARKEAQIRAVAQAKEIIKELIKILDGKKVDKAVADAITGLVGLIEGHERRGSLKEERDSLKDDVDDQEREIKKGNLRAQFAVRGLRLPTQKPSKMIPVPIIIQKGKAFPCVRLDGKGKFVINKTAVKFSKGKKGAIAKIVDSGGLLDVAVFLATLDHSKHYPTYVVYQDSFKEFDSFKRTTTSKDFQYAWTPKMDKENVEMGKSGDKLPVE